MRPAPVLDAADVRAIQAWMIQGQAGLSSMAIAARMLGQEPGRRGWFHPRDPDDFNRCLLLLEDVPALRAHLPLMADCSPEWAALVGAWELVEATFGVEFGRDRRGRDPNFPTYRLMQRLYAAASAPQGAAA